MVAQDQNTAVGYQHQKTDFSSNPPKKRHVWHVWHSWDAKTTMTGHEIRASTAKKSSNLTKSLGPGSGHRARRSW